MKNIDSNQCNKDFGDFIRAARLRKGMTQADIAEKLKVSQVYISHFERGERDIDLVTAMTICDILEVDIRRFFDYYI